MTHPAAPIPRTSSHRKKSLEDDDLDDGEAKTSCMFMRMVNIRTIVPSVEKKMS